MYKRYVSLIFETLLNAHEKRGKKRFFLLPMSQVFKIWLRIRHFFIKKGFFKPIEQSCRLFVLGVFLSEDPEKPLL